jgi:hypothetical protein
VLLNVTSGPSAVLWVGAVIALAALGFAGCGLGELHESGAIGAKLFRYRTDRGARPMKSLLEMRKSKVRFRGSTRKHFSF